MIDGLDTLNIPGRLYIPILGIFKQFFKVSKQDMACSDCKTERWQISLKFNEHQKIDAKFHKSVRDFLEAMLLDRSTEQIKQIVEFAIMCDTSLILDDIKDKINVLKEACFTHGIPIQVKSMRMLK